MKHTIVTKISILLMGQMILQILFRNLPSPLSSFYFYFLFFIISILVTKPSVLVSKTNKKIIFFALYYIVFFIFGLYDPEKLKSTSIDPIPYNISWLFQSELLPIFLSTTLFTYFSSYEKIESLILLMRYVLVFIIITLITSLIGLHIFPEAARGISGDLQYFGEYELTKYYQKIGIAAYGLYYGLAYAMPVFIMLIKKYWNQSWKRNILILFILLSMYAIIVAQMTTALLFSVVAILLSIVGTKNIKKSVAFFIITIIISLAIPHQYYSNIIKSFSANVPGEILETRLLDISSAIEYESQDIKENETHISNRKERIPLLLNNFYKSPLIGGGVSTQHNFWLDRLSLFGLFGLIPWVILMYSIIKSVIKKLNEQYMYTYYLSILLFITIGFIKNSGGSLVYLFEFFIVPSILLIYSNNRSIFNKNEQ